MSIDDHDLRIITNIRLTTPMDGVTLDHVQNYASLNPWGLFRRLIAADAIVMKLPSKYLALLSATAKLVSPNKPLVYYDVLIPAATGWSKIKRWFWLQLVRRADLILALQKDTSEYARLLRLPPERLKYIGFKSNVWEDSASVARGASTRDQGTYVLACGRSYRDFATFTKAMELANLPARILLTQGSLEASGAIPPPKELPQNVTLIQHDGTRQGWIEALLGARIVVVPMRGDVISPAVSVPLEAMNLSRPVIITEGPATRGMLDDTIAGIVPPADAAALARETLRVWHDDELRLSRIDKAWEYVQDLGGEDRMSRDILRETLTRLGKNVAPSPDRPVQQK